MALLPTGRYCDHISQRKPGAPERQCHRRAQHTIKGRSGGNLDYCNKHIEIGLREYPQHDIASAGDRKSLYAWELDQDSIAAIANTELHSKRSAP